MSKQAQQVYWVEAPELAGRIAIVRRPHGFDRLAASLRAYHDAGLGMIVSMLEPDEARHIGLAAQGSGCRELGLMFASFPIADFSVPPSMEDAVRFIDDLASHVTDGRSIGLHCLASRGRSPTMAACLLVRLGLTVEDAIERLSQARGIQVPETNGQLEWIQAYRDRIHVA